MSLDWLKYFSLFFVEVSKGTKIRNRYNQVPQLTIPMGK